MMINPIAMFDYKPGHGVPAYPFISFTLIGRESGMSTEIEGLVDSGADATMIPVSILSHIQARKTDDAWTRTFQASDT
ncbi:MAG: hypothetical protein AAF639_36475 [Chloroflexota bacterium]